MKNYEKTIKYYFMCNIYTHGLKLVSIPLHQVIFISKICNIYPHGLKLVSVFRHQIIFMWKTCNTYTYYSLKTGIDISTPKYFHVQNIQYLCTRSETGIDMSTPNYFHVENMQYLYVQYTA